MTDIEVLNLELLERKYHEATIAYCRAGARFREARNAYDETYRQREDALRELHKYPEQLQQVKNDASPDALEDPKK